MSVVGARITGNRCMVRLNELCRAIHLGESEIYWTILWWIALLLIAVLALAKLTDYPRTWFDEGMNLELAKNLARFGRYVQSPESTWAFDTPASTGPTVIGPIALVFRVFGAGLLQARLVMAGYVLLAALGLFWVGEQLYGRPVAVISLFVYASITDAGPFANGRQATGEIPGCAFLYAGAAVLIRAQATARTYLYPCAGLLFGLAILSKSQFGVLVPLLIGLWLVERRLGRRFSRDAWFLLVAGLGAPLAAWYGWQYVALGPVGFAQELQQIALVGSPSYVLLRRAPGAVAGLATSGFLTWGAAGLLYVWALILRDRSGCRAGRLLLPAFVVAWITWYLGFSIGWIRYAIPAVLTSSLFVARLFYQLARDWPSGGYGENRAGGSSLLENPTRAAFLAALVLSVSSGVVTNGVAIARAHDRSPQTFAGIVDQDVPPGAVVESFEWEVDFLSDARFHEPPPALMVDAIDVAFLSRPSGSTRWYQVPSSATYLVDGPFSKMTGLYRQTLDLGSFRKIASFGEYDLYRRECWPLSAQRAAP